MSYDLWLNHDSFNMTSNVGPMFRRCIPKGIQSIHNLTGKQAQPVLLKLFIEMHVHKEELESMNPKNGWGDYESAKAWVLKLWNASRENRRFRWKVCS